MSRKELQGRVIYGLVEVQGMLQWMVHVPYAQDL